MPNNPFKFKVSTIKPTVVLFAKPFLKEPIKKILRKKGISIRSPKTAEKEKNIDYVVDATKSNKAISLAQKQKAKYLAISQDLNEEFNFKDINARILRTDFLVGPKMQIKTPLGQMLTAAVKNEEIPIPKGKNIFPLHVQDLARAVWQALVMPNTMNKEFLVLGLPTTLGHISEALILLGQTTKGASKDSNLEIINYSQKKLKEAFNLLDWQPSLEPSQALEKAFFSLISDPRLKKTQTAYLKIEKEEEKPTKPVSKFVPKIEKYLPKKEKPDPEEEEIIIIEEAQSPIEVPKTEEIEQIIDRWQIAKKDKEEEQKKTKRKKINISWEKLIFPPILIILTIFLSTWIKPICTIGLGFWQTKSALTQIQNQNWEKSKNLTKNARKNFYTANIFINQHPAAVLLFGIKKQIEQVSKTGLNIANSIETAIPLSENSILLADNIFQGKESNFQASIEQIQAGQRQLSWQLAQLEACLRANWRLPPRWKNLPSKWADHVGQMVGYLNKSEKIIENLPWIIGADGDRRSFLVLLQNNMELRATGGFIGSFALVTFQDGSLIDFDVKDVYSADGQLKGHVEPPTEIKKILGEANWYLRDSNWDPDFIESAKNAEWFLSKELGRDVDGVIGFNLEAAKKIIDAFGEIYLSDFNEKISADNLFERAEFWTENEFFPGSTQKMAFLGLLGQQLFESVKAAEAAESLKLVQALIDSLEENEITIYAHDTKFAYDLRNLGWDGAIKNPLCQTDNCLNDYLFLVESNMGVNKANYFLRRSIEQIIDIKKNGQLDQTIKINYENTASSNNWPGGRYLNWMRIYLPANKIVKEVLINDPLNPQQRQTIPPSERKEEIINGKKVLSFKMEVPINQRRTLEVKLSQKENLSGDSFSYVLYWQKQPGYQETPTSVLISFPIDWQPVSVNPAANIISNKLLFNQQLNKDINLGVAFEK